MPLVSVVVPTHNRPEFLAEALASVRAQTFTDYEIIVVSNGEAPEMRHRSEAIAPQFGCRYFSLHRGNVSLARNFGIDRAEGEWIAILDDDDLFVPTKLEHQLAESQRTGADMIVADYVEFWNDGREVVTRRRPPEGWSLTKAASHTAWWTATGATLVRKRVYQELGGFDPRQRMVEDNDMWRRITWRHKVHLMDEVVFRYRRGHSSIMQKGERLHRLYDLRMFVKMHIDTPLDLRSELPSFRDFAVWRIGVIIGPKLAGFLRPRTRLNALKRMLRSS